ncbi:MAG: response regulator, partial [Gammaproteobacteria bacterium]|nr:response regulator [Gammaproteobacteria bacterium]
GTDNIEVLAEASNGSEALQIVKKVLPDVVLMDVEMPSMDGLEATHRMIRANPRVRIIVLTVHDSDVFPARLLEEGALGYLTKGCSPEEMIRAIRTVALGQPYISPEIAQKLALKRFAGSKASPFDELSERELQVMMLIVKGKKPQEIATVLHLSPKTINTYRYRLFDKLSVKSDVELTLLYLDHGMDGDRKS